MARIGQAEAIPQRARVAGACAHDDLERDSPASPRAHQRASLDAHLREQPAHRGTAGERAQRARRRNTGAIAPRVARPAAADRSRRSAQGRTHPRAGGHLLARAGHRHGRDRSRHPDRGAAVGRERHAANRPIGPHHRRGEPRHHRPQVPGRSGGVRRGHPRDARGADREHQVSAQPARRPCAADRRDGVDGSMDGRGALRRRPAGCTVCRARQGHVRGRARHALGPLSVGRLRRSPAAADVGPARERGDGARGCEADRGDQRRHDPRPRPVRRVPGGRARSRGACGRARRRDGLREPRGRDIPARRVELAHRPDHSRPRARDPCPGRARQDALLEGGRDGPAAGARTHDRRARAHARGPAACCRDRAAGPSPRSRRAGGRESPALSLRSTRRGRRRPRRPHGAHRALPRRAGRLARLRPLAIRQPHPRPLGHGRRRTCPRGNQGSTSKRCGPTTGSW